MRLWKLASGALWEKLVREQVLYCDLSRVRDRELLEWLLPSYEWMRGQMAKRLPSFTGHYPWWTWYQWDPGRRCPDLREPMNHYGEQGTLAVRMELEIPDEEVLLSDFEAWNVVLNNNYFTWTQADFEAWEALPEAEQSSATLESSWERIFTLDNPNADPNWWHPQAQRIQACFETLRLADVVRVTPFVSRWRTLHRSQVK